MRIVTAEENGSTTTELQDSANFKEFAVIADNSSIDKVDRALVDSGAGSVVDGYAWITRTFLEANAPETPSDWSHQFEKMVEFASSKGWVSEDGLSIRAHIDLQ